MNKIISFFRESYQEMTENVTWTKYTELQNHSLLVLIASLIFAVVIYLFDISFQKGLEAFYGSF